MTGRQVYTAVVALVAVLGLFVASLVISDHRDRERAKDICGLIVLMDDAYGANRPGTQLGQRMADEVHRYRLRLGC